MAVLVSFKQVKHININKAIYLNCLVWRKTFGMLVSIKNSDLLAHCQIVNRHKPKILNSGFPHNSHHLGSVLFIRINNRYYRAQLNSI